MRKRILGISVMTATLVAGLLAAPTWAASSLKTPAPPRADAAVDQPEPPPPGGFCLDIDRDRRYTCVGRTRPRAEAGNPCNVLIRVGTLLAVTDCNPSSPRAIRPMEVAGAVAAPAALAGSSSQEKQQKAEGPLGNGFCLNLNRDNTYTCVLRNKPATEPSCEAIIGIPGVLVHTDCTPRDGRRGL